MAACAAAQVEDAGWRCRQGSDESGEGFMGVDEDVAFPAKNGVPGFWGGLYGLFVFIVHILCFWTGAILNMILGTTLAL
jgi:hypothetical protein